MTALILGASGMLGRELRRQFPEARALTRGELDISDREALSSVVRPGVELVLNAAADTRVDRAESDPHHRRINEEAVGTLAELSARAGAFLVHVSTDYVFDGKGTRPYREDDPVDPVNEYGRGKLGGEELMRFFAKAPRALHGVIVRTSWVFGHGGVNFVDTILRAVEGGRAELKVVVDQIGRPTFARDLAIAIRRLVERREAYAGEAERVPTVHFANSGDTTWFDLARMALIAADRRDVIVRPCPTGDFPRPARRPGYSVLDTARYESWTWDVPRSWREAVVEYVSERAAAPRAGEEPPPRAALDGART